MFTGLPLHAATDSTHFIHSYTLILGGNHPRRNPPNWKIGIIGVPNTDGQKKLENVEKEVHEIAQLVRLKPNLSKPEVLLGEAAEIGDVKRLLSRCSWIHFACHGTQDREEPQNSSLSLYDKPLNLESIFGLDLQNAEFVFLSACETVTGDGTVKNEALHLCGGFLAAGFQGAIGTLWTMDDRDGPTLAEAVYRYLLQNPNGPKVTDAAKALQNAVRDLRMSPDVSPERWATFIHIGV
jgi:CHAT domain-containing protein